MDSGETLENINAKIGILNFQRELIESQNWDDKTHLEKKYEMHLNNFDNVVKYLCNSVGVFRIGEINKNGVFIVEKQEGEKENFDIHKDYTKEREGKLVSYVEFSEKRKAYSLLIYSPTKGINFEYFSRLSPKNVQLGRADYFGKAIEKIVRNAESATDDIKFNHRFDRFEKEPRGIKEFALYTNQYVPKEKYGDAMGIISTLDGIIRGIWDVPFWISGPNFIHEKEESLFNTGIKISID